MASLEREQNARIIPPYCEEQSTRLISAEDLELTNGPLA